MADYVFVNITENHFKVWGYEAFMNEESGESEIITYWGRIGTPMHRLQKHKKYIPSWHDARKYVHGKIDEKIWKGYKGFPNSMYFQMIQSPKGIAALIDKIAQMGNASYYKRKKRTA